MRRGHRREAVFLHTSSADISANGLTKSAALLVCRTAPTSVPFIDCTGGTKSWRCPGRAKPSSTTDLPPPCTSPSATASSCATGTWSPSRCASPVYLTTMSLITASWTGDCLSRGPSCAGQIGVCQFPRRRGWACRGGGHHGLRDGGRRVRCVSVFFLFFFLFYFFSFFYVFLGFFFSLFFLFFFFFFLFFYFFFFYLTGGLGAGLQYALQHPLLNLLIVL